MANLFTHSNYHANLQQVQYDVSNLHHEYLYAQPATAAAALRSLLPDNQCCWVRLSQNTCSLEREIQRLRTMQACVAIYLTGETVVVLLYSP